ncbi:hypothetical protein GS399_04365 [Pedobacter sp. HMF7647]|uniref:Ava_C0101 and related proteins n=1 Tax=Hufsiella arboris TaxID=2695275 RepID=A0A7K1Y6J3_9SPHI|nr:DUF5996 family protein [Hufsiella arboris]MXV50194.1 hypothetical protein [Hufsiella arboris]
MSNNRPHRHWPELEFEKLKETLSLVHLLTQIVGKIRLTQTPWINHSWHVPLYISATGFTTAGIPFDKGIFQIDFNFISHRLEIITSTAQNKSLILQSGSVAGFYEQIMSALRSSGIEPIIYPVPNELETAIPFENDVEVRSYDAPAIHTLWKAMVQINNVFTEFRAGFRGKCSPVHLFWGAFDLAVTRFSGKEAPKHPGGAPNIPVEIMQEAYSQEVSSAGFWPGSDQFPHPVFYSYCYPTPENFSQQPVKPDQAFFSKEMGEFMLTYEAVQRSDNPRSMLLDFLNSTYEAAANTAKWDRETLECNLEGLKTYSPNT